jgi:butyryl-CoA dehydrogenase
MSYRTTVEFLLYGWLDAESLRQRPRFADHSRETFDAVIDTCERVAREKFAPFNRLADTEEPWFDGEKVHLPAASHAAAQAYSCRVWSRWRRTPSSRRRASASVAAAC